MTSSKLFMQAIRLLTEDPIRTLIVVGPVALVMIAVCALTLALAPELLSVGASVVAPADLPLNGLTALLLMTFIFSYALMAILWHRHTLGDTHTSLPLNVPLVLGYLWRVLILALIQLCISLAFIVPLILSNQNGGSTAGAPSLISILITTFLSQWFLVWLSLRLSLILPAAAIGRPMRMTHSWQYTHGLAGPLWGVAAVLALFNTALTAVITHLGLKTPIFLLMFELPVYILEGLLIFSILTTIYACQIKHNPPSPV